MPTILTVFVRLEASAIPTSEASVTGDFVELVTVKVFSPLTTVVNSVPLAFMSVKVLSLPFLTVRVPLPIVKTTFEPLSEVFEIAAPIEILSPEA